MHHKFKLLAVAAAAAMTPQVARADFAGSGCGGSPFIICASWSLVGQSAGIGGNYTLSVTNTGAYNPNSAITQVALGATGSGVDITSLVAPAGWQIQDANGQPYNGFGMLFFAFDANTTNGINNALNPGETLVFQFSATAPAGVSFNQIGFHDQGAPNLQCSAKAVFNLNGADQPGIVTNVDPNCGGTTVPEPATMTLVGTGIAGILAARRRRRQLQTRE